MEDFNYSLGYLIELIAEFFCLSVATSSPPPWLVRALSSGYPFAGELYGLLVPGTQPSGRSCGWRWRSNRLGGYGVEAEILTNKNVREYAINLDMAKEVVTSEPGQPVEAACDFSRIK